MTESEQQPTSEALPPRQAPATDYGQAGRHSPEPWRSVAMHPTQTLPLYDIEACEPGSTLAELLDEADARRIVACVNACAGLPTEALEAGCLGEGALRSDITTLRAAAIDLLAQRNLDGSLSLDRMDIALVALRKALQETDR